MTKKSAEKKPVTAKESATIKAIPKNNECENLKKLLRSNMLKGFIRKNNGEWNHHSWLEFCEEIKVKNYIPIDFDTVGLHLEELKTSYLRGELS